MSGNLASGQRMSQLFGQTLREAPSEAEVISHQLLLRAGFIRQLAAGVFTYLPLAWRSLRKIENILREEMDAIGGQEMTMPVVHPADVWQETGRWYEIGPEMARFKDRQGRDMVLAMTHEEVVADLARRDIRSYRQLPQLIYHIQTKFRDDPRPRAGLIRVREFDMKDCYSLDRDEAGLDKQYRAHYQAYFNIFNRCALPAIAVGSDVGMMGGKLAHEYMYLTPIGEDTLMLCDACGYAANRQIARFAKPPAPQEDARPIEKVATPDTKTIDALATLAEHSQVKDGQGRVPHRTIPQDGRGRGTIRLCRDSRRHGSERDQARQRRQSQWLRPATEDEIRAVGASRVTPRPSACTTPSSWPMTPWPHRPTWSPARTRRAITCSTSTWGATIPPTSWPTLPPRAKAMAARSAASLCAPSRGVEVGNIFKLGTRYSERWARRTSTRTARPRPIVMGSYGIGPGRLLACVAEEHHDDKGLIWPVTIAPYHVSLVWLPSNSAETQATAERIYQSLAREWRRSVVRRPRGDARRQIRGRRLDRLAVAHHRGATGRWRKAASNSSGVIARRKPSCPKRDLLAAVRAELQSLHDDIARRVVPVMFPDT